MRLALVFGSSSETQSLIVKGLESSFRLISCATPADAGECLTQNNVDVALLDLGLEGEPALSLCEAIRREARWNSLPVIFLSSVRDTRMTVRAFEVGGDDLAHVPFAPEELAARVEARFKRLRTQPVVHDLFWKADLRFSLGTQRVVYTDASGEHDLELTPNEFKILYFLARNEGAILTRQGILSEVWGENLHVVERTVDKHICSLRRKMGERSYYVASVPGSGYCFSPTGFKSAEVESPRLQKASL